MITPQVLTKAHLTFAAQEFYAQLGLLSWDLANLLVLQESRLDVNPSRTQQPEASIVCKTLPSVQGVSSACLSFVLQGGAIPLALNYIPSEAGRVELTARGVFDLSNNGYRTELSDNYNNPLWTKVIFPSELRAELLALST